MAVANDVETLRKVLLGHVQVQSLILQMLDAEGILPLEKPIRVLQEYVTAADKVDPDGLISLAGNSILKLLKPGSDHNLAEVIPLDAFRNHPKTD
jgi:hypothetical protein